MKNVIMDIDFIIENAGDVWKHINKHQPLSRINSFLFGLTERLYFTSLGLKPLLNEIHKVPQVEFSIGIILRSQILDILTALNFHKALNPIPPSTTANTVNAEQFANEILADGLRLTMKYFEVAKNNGLITQDELVANYSDLVKRFPMFFEAYNHDGTVPKLKFTVFHAPEKLFVNVRQQKEMKELSRFYDLYQFYSKYDHYGILYFELIRQPISEKNKYIEDVVKGMVFHLFTLVTALSIVNNGDSYYEEKLKSMAPYLTSRLGK